VERKTLKKIPELPPFFLAKNGCGNR